MENEKTDEKLKNIEKEIDSAIDKLFVDKIGSEEKIDEILSEQPEPFLEKEISPADDTPEEPIVLNEKILEDENIPSPEFAEQESKPEPAAGALNEYEQTIEKINTKITALSEWGITKNAVDKILNDIAALSEKIRENKLAFAVSGMITDVMTFFRNNPESPEPDLIKFLSEGFSALKSLLASGDESNEPEDIFATINDQFSGISSKLTIDIPKIEMDSSLIEGNKFNEDIIEPSEENKSIQLEPAEIAANSSQDSPEEKKENDDALSLDMSFIDPDLPDESAAEITPSHEESIESAGNIPLPVQPKKDTEVPASYYKNMLKEITQSVRSIQKESFLIQEVIEFTEKLFVEIESLETLTNKFMAAMATGIPAQNNLKQLQDSVSDLSEDFQIFSQIVGKRDGEDTFRAEEITPVVVGGRMIGLLSESIDHLYSITPQQEKIFRKTGYVSLNSAKIPFVDLIEELGETSENKNKRLLVIDTPKGRRALLADKILKKRFAFTNVSSSSSSEEYIQIARFFLTEEIMVYKIK
jgi:hypothetical protein